MSTRVSLTSCRFTTSSRAEKNRRNRSARGTSRASGATIGTSRNEGGSRRFSSGTTAHTGRRSGIDARETAHASRKPWCRRRYDGSRRRNIWCRRRGECSHLSGRLVSAPVRLRTLPVTIDFVGRRAWNNQGTIDLTYREFAVLRYLAERADSVVHRDELLREIWGYPESPNTRAVDHAVARLRRKIETDPPHPRFIHTVHGDGYSLTNGQVPAV